MSPSDFLTILGLALAVWALIPSIQKRFILLFFSKWELGILISSLFYIHFLMAFEWLSLTWFPWLSAVTIVKGLPSSTWAYIIALATIFYPIVKVSFGYFSRSRIRDMINLYETYLKQDEIDLLAGFISKYHIEDIKKYLQGVSRLPKKEGKDIVLRKRTEKDVQREKLIKPKKILFGSLAYRRIIQNEHFIRKAANKYSELFATAISGMETRGASNRDLVQLYIECLFESKNQKLIDELRVMNNSYSSVLEMSQNYELPILSALLNHSYAAAANYVWYPVGEGAVRSIKYDDIQKAFLLKKYEHDLEVELWHHKIYIAIVYFNYMVRESIYRNGEWHMWLFYFRSSTDSLIEAIPVENDYDKNSDRPSFLHFMISEQFDVMIGWLKLAQELNTDNRVIDTVRCLGWCVNSICEADDSKISIPFKRRQLDRILSIYFEFSTVPDNTSVILIREWIEKLLLNPKGVDFGRKETSDKYLEALADAWHEFDKVPYQYQEDNGSIQVFETNVLTSLGINE